MTFAAPTSPPLRDLVRRHALRTKMFGAAGPAPTLGRYRLDRVVGEGAMGVVYLGHDARLERPVAIKVLREGLRTGAERLEREARVLAKLAHPNVVTIHEVGEDGEHAFIAMEYVHGTTLREWMNEVHSIEERTDIVVQAAAGLAAAHALGLVHRDFKPDNAMVGEDGRLRLLDFGLASTPLAENLLITGPSKRGWSRITETGAVLGTPAYLAPELLRGARPSAASDQFSLCCAGWEVLCGQHPISDGSFVEVQPSPMVPPHVVAALRRGLADDPTARHSSVEALRDALRPTSATTNATTSQGRRKLAIALGVAALAMAVAGRAWITERQPVDRVAADWGASNDVAGCKQQPRFSDSRRLLLDNERRAEAAVALALPLTLSRYRAQEHHAGALLALGRWEPACDNLRELADLSPPRPIAACWIQRYCGSLANLPGRTQCFGGDLRACELESIKHEYEFLEAKKSARDEPLASAAADLHHAQMLEMLLAGCEQGQRSLCETYVIETERSRDQ